MQNEYTYAVARIRAKEMSLLSKVDVDTLMSCRSLDECIRFLADKGWAECSGGDYEKMLSAEEDKLWSLINELTGEDRVFDVFRYPTDFHNLKASIKSVVTDVKEPEIFFLDRGTAHAKDIYKAIQEKDFDSLPEHLKECAKKAYHTLLRTSDGQLCDIIIDKASLEYVREVTKNSKCTLLKDYAELTVAAADIKIAVRCLKTGKNHDFIKNALAECDTLNVTLLAEAASKTLDDIYNYLAYTDYSNALEYLKKSPSEFERYCDNILMEKIKEQKLNNFTAAPIAAYFLARQNEIKTVRLILSGKQNDIDDNIIRERLRDMYV